MRVRPRWEDIELCSMDNETIRQGVLPARIQLGSLKRDPFYYKVLVLAVAVTQQDGLHADMLPNRPYETARMIALDLDSNIRPFVLESTSCKSHLIR